MINTYLTRDNFINSVNVLHLLNVLFCPINSTFFLLDEAFGRENREMTFSFCLQAYMSLQKKNEKKANHFYLHKICLTIIFSIQGTKLWYKNKYKRFNSYHKTSYYHTYQRVSYLILELGWKMNNVIIFISNGTTLFGLRINKIKWRSLNKSLMEESY